MTAFSRALILAGLVAVTGASGALADAKDRNTAQPQQGYESSAPAYQSSVLQEGRASAADSVQHRDNRNWLTDRRSSEYNHR
jgi:hypothetical protein